VDAFLQRRMAFGEIATVVRRTLAAHRSLSQPTLEDVLAADRWARKTAAGFGVEVR
jgi:1-deoxy-D-xylulose-5-phosphate reductoisomerase